MLRCRFLSPLVLALFACAIASASSVVSSGATVNMKFLHPGTNSSGGFYTYPYYFSVNGGAPTAMMCDAFANHVSVGETWKAHVSGLLSGHGLFGHDMTNYKAAGLIFLGVINGTISAASGNWAVWNLFDKGITTNAAVLAIDKTALAAAQYASASLFKGLAIYTPVGASPGHGPQEFIGYRTSVISTPEPGSLTLLSTGLLGIATLIRKKVRA